MTSRSGVKKGSKKFRGGRSYKTFLAVSYRKLIKFWRKVRQKSFIALTQLGNFFLIFNADQNKLTCLSPAGNTLQAGLMLADKDRSQPIELAPQH